MHLLWMVMPPLSHARLEPHAMPRAWTSRNAALEPDRVLIQNGDVEEGGGPGGGRGGGLYVMDLTDVVLSQSACYLVGSEALERLSLERSCSLNLPGVRS